MLTILLLMMVFFIWLDSSSEVDALKAALVQKESELQAKHDLRISALEKKLAAALQANGGADSTPSGPSSSSSSPFPVAASAPASTGHAPAAAAAAPSPPSLAAIPPPPLAAPAAPPAPPLPGVSGLPPPPPPPPPPPGVAAVVAPFGRTRTALPKPAVQLKQVHWTKLPNSKIAGTVWEDLKDVDLSFAFDAMAEKFGQRSKQKKQVKDVVATAVQDKIEMVHLIDAKRSYNVELTLARFKGTSLQEIRDAVLQFDNTFISQDRLEQLMKIAPTAEDIETVKAFTGDASKLGTTERFFLAMADVPRLDDHLHLWMFQLTFDESYAELKSNISMVKQALQELHSSEKLRGLMEVVLAAGNFLNNGSQKGDAYGFRLGALNSLSSTKATDNTNLVDFIFSVCNQRFSHLLDFASEIESITNVAKIEQRSLTAKFQGIKSMIAKLKAFVEQLETEASSSSLMTAFYDQALQKTTDLDSELTKVLLESSRLLSFFGEDGSSGVWEELFGTFEQFMQTWKSAKVTFEKKEKDIQRASLAKQKKSHNPSPLKQTPNKKPSHVVHSADTKTIWEQLKERRAASGLDVSRCKVL